jgi:N-acyl-D-aspartate/D-glutamate deacylase
MRFPVSLLILITLVEFTGCNQPEYDIVFAGGQVYDPETGLSERRNVGINGDRIAKISKDQLQGKKLINVTGLVVSPGFIDLHVHGTTFKENQYQIHDGVTTALDLEFGASSIEEFIEKRNGSSLVNFGASVAQGQLRMQAMKAWKNRVEGEPVDYNFKALDDEEIEEMKVLVQDQINKGGLGIGVPIGYYPAATRREIYEVYKLAHELSVPVFSHIRMGRALAVQQVLADAMTTGASLHIVHINSSSGNELDLTLEMIQGARQKGFDITTETYPYTAGSTDIASAIFQPGWQENLGISFNDLQWVETGERLTEETFNQYRKIGGIVIVHQMKPEWIDLAVRSPLTMIASDGMMYSRLAHPRTAGTFSRVLGKYVREDNVLTLMEALTKMTVMPAKRLEKIAPDMKKRGRMQEGCFADITVFDPGKIVDKATFDEGLKYSEGIHYVMVNGAIVLHDGKLVPDVLPGRPVLGTYPQP